MNGSDLANDENFDLAVLAEILLKALGQLIGDLVRVGIIDGEAVDEDPNLFSVLQGEGILDPGVIHRRFFDVVHSLEEIGYFFLHRPGAMGGDFIGRLYEDGHRGAPGLILHMCFDHLDDLVTLSTLACQGGTGLGEIGADVMVQGFGDIVQQTRTPSDGDIHVKFFCHHAGKKSYFFAVGEKVLTVARTEVQLAKVLQQRLGHIVDAEIEGCL